MPVPGAEHDESSGETSLFLRYYIGCQNCLDNIAFISKRIRQIILEAHMSNPSLETGVQ